MKCSICCEDGHRRNSKKHHPENVKIASNETVASNKKIAIIENTVIEHTLEPIVIQEIDFSNDSACLAKLSVNLNKCVKGYHLLNDEPIKESTWEDINSTVLVASGYECSNNKGSHISGKDLYCTFGGFSNKTTKYEGGNNSFKISSYRLTKVCSNKTIGTIEQIIAEIDKRKNFQYYSILVREESDTHILYVWYIIPGDYPALQPSSYNWRHSISKNEIKGWENRYYKWVKYVHYL
jgi:hypothetical protein